MPPIDLDNASQQILASGDGKMYSRYPAGNAPGGALAPALMVEYVDGSGVLREETITEGATISGIAPFLVHFDASGTRAPAAWASDEANFRSALNATGADSSVNDDAGMQAFYAWARVGYRINYGENIGGTWPYPTAVAASRDEDTGPPIFKRVFTQVGTSVVRLKVRDVLGNESTLSFNVVVQAPPTPTLIPRSAGSWPAFTSGSHYTLEAGEDYTSFGPISLRGQHNILFSKAGAGDDPIIGDFAADAYSWSDRNTPNLVRTRHCRVMDVAVARMTWTETGFEYCGVIRGSCGGVAWGANDAAYDSPDRNDAQRTNVRFTRGLFLWETGELRNINDPNYVTITELPYACFYGVRVMSDNIGGSGSVLRDFRYRTAYRYCLFRATGPTDSNVYFRGQAKESAAQGAVPEPYIHSDLTGTTTAPYRRYGYPCSYVVLYQNQFYLPGDYQWVRQAMGHGPQNDINGDPYEGHEFIALEGNRSGLPGFNQGSWNPEGARVDGRFSVIGDNIGSDGTVLGTGPTSLTNPRIPPLWKGPIYPMPTTTRPVPTGF